MKNAMFAAVLLLAWPHLAIGQTSDAALNASRLALAAGCALDLSSTLYGVTSGHVVEGNALLEAVVGDAKAHPVRLYLVKAASCGTTHLIALRLSSARESADEASYRRRRKAAFWLTTGAAAANIAFGLWNLSQIREAKSRASVPAAAPPAGYSISITF